MIMENRMSEDICNMCKNKISDYFDDPNEDIFHDADINVDMYERDNWGEGYVRCINISVCRKCFLDKIVPLCKIKPEYKDKSYN